MTTAAPGYEEAATANVVPDAASAAPCDAMVVINNGNRDDARATSGAWLDGQERGEEAGFRPGVGAGPEIGGEGPLSHSTPPPIELSIVIPAYNEARRLPPFLDDIRAYFDQILPLGYEVIVVDDGSTDGTAEFVRSWLSLTILRHAANRGKGAAVRTGVMAARGRLILFADADGATPIEEERGLRGAIDAGAALAVGSRLLQADVVRRRLGRGLVGRIFALLARALLRVEVRDPQCGFKMFRRDSAQCLFAACPEDGYLFDLHILADARRLGYPIAERPVRWFEVPGSKVDLLRDSWRMLVGLWRIHSRQHHPRPGGPAATDFPLI